MAAVVWLPAGTAGYEDSRTRWIPAGTAGAENQSAVAQSAAVSPATITLTPVALGASPGTVSVALSPATITLTPEALGASPGTVSVALSPATITLEPLALGASPGTVSVALSPATITLVAQALGFSATDPTPIRRRHRTDTDARDLSANRPTGPRGRETTWWD